MERTRGCLLRWKCLVACLFLEESQQPTWPQDMHRRRWTQVSPILMQSSQTVLSVVLIAIWFRWVHFCDIFLTPGKCSELSSFELFAIPMGEIGARLVGALQETEQGVPR